MRNIIKTLAVAALMMSAVAAFAQMPGAGQKPGSNQRPSVQKVSSSDYTVRGTKVYYGRVELRDADYRTFVDLGHGYAKDNDNVWWNGAVLPYVDATSFRLTTQSGRPGQVLVPLLEWVQVMVLVLPLVWALEWLQVMVQVQHPELLAMA